uniref:Fork-head domain-containing protein n=1 Tax=Acanthochromis polyacanthus TaxID=80966 RepID=A0A3Q1G4T9_9TELE
MQNGTENFGALLPSDPPQRTFFNNNTTHLAKIAVILQDAPRKMLTFAKLMDKMVPLIGEDRHSTENNIRVCLTTNKCFVKTPVVPGAQHSKRNYWKLDYNQITAKMVRRHFKGILHLFPELASKVETEQLNRPPEHQPAGSRAVQVRNQVRFSSPFAIESLLKRETFSIESLLKREPEASTSSPPSNVTPRAEQQHFPTTLPKQMYSMLRCGKL